MTFDLCCCAVANKNVFIHMHQHLYHSVTSKKLFFPAVSATNCTRNQEQIPKYEVQIHDLEGGSTEKIL